MSIEFKLPEVSEGVNEAEISSITVKEGDSISAGSVVMEVETEKAVAEIECPHAGTVSKIHVSEGDSVPIGAVLLTIAESNGAPAQEEAKSAEPKEEKEEPKAEKPAKEQEPPKKEESKPSSPQPAQQTQPTTSEAGKIPPPATPSTRRLARELGVDLHQVNGTGPGGRITVEDVQGFVRQLTSGGGSGGGGPVTAPPLPDFSQYGEVERRKLSKLERTAASHLSMAWQVIPHVTQHDLADITNLEESRKTFMSTVGKNGPKVTMTAVAVKAAVNALKAYPNFNASYDAQSGELVLKQYYNIGIAVDTPYGLVVPVIKNADKKSILDIAQETTELAIKARDRKLSMDEMQGGTFTITNLGGIGGTGFTPIVNYPEVAILGMCRSRNELRLDQGEIVERMMMPISLSYDHRVINGADAARFVSKLVRSFSDMFQLLTDC
ncbi:Dihydrolipoyllysine-residue acetyltransferase component of pyruvate dehydrogenase complex [Polystyrenella longa]|uniref:Dihydrolipoamide acetyltransferase component of pyruvate dehydrogenase complex n=1 Tax=Polystyrenella longa TaxID=2528007 RepID=A0A518CRL3_9PLAN|nr:2-oxo acid dehydrogenase subunit E2 [Polystyrenella longa]QDU81872.1 Dihydrolipoyllysine-residue acetyltransferase component of pyruvate dehydrogenase complex [Polystyrenella longa]